MDGCVGNDVCDRDSLGVFVWLAGNCSGMQTLSAVCVGSGVCLGTPHVQVERLPDM